MMKFSSNAIVGLGFTAFMLVSFYFTIIKQVDIDSKYPYKLKLYYSKIDGIRKGTEVYLNGILFGMVNSFQEISANDVPDKRFLEYGKSDAIELVLKISEPLTLWNNYKIRFKNTTMFSGRTIEIDPGSYEGESSTYFQPSFRTGEKIPDFSPSASYYDDFFASSARLIEDNRPEIKIAVENLTEVSTKLQYGNGTLPQFINNDIVYDALAETASDLSIFGKDLRRTQESLRESNIIPAPFAINLYKRNTTIGRISDRLYVVKPQSQKNLELYYKSKLLGL